MHGSSFVCHCGNVIRKSRCWLRGVRVGEATHPGAPMYLLRRRGPHARSFREFCAVCDDSEVELAAPDGPDTRTFSGFTCTFQAGTSPFFQMHKMAATGKHFDGRLPLWMPARSSAMELLIAWTSPREDPVSLSPRACEVFATRAWEMNPVFLSDEIGSGNVLRSVRGLVVDFLMFVVVSRTKIPHVYVTT